MNQYYYDVPVLRLYHLSMTFAEYEKMAFLKIRRIRKMAFLKNLAIEDILNDSLKQTILIFLKSVL